MRAIDGQKQCCHCHEIKPLSEFQKQRSQVDGLHPRCKPCLRAWDRARYKGERKRKMLERVARWQKNNPKRRRFIVLKHAYGITESAYRELERQQDGRCAVCRGGLWPGKRWLSVDHCHTTGSIRGLLCDGCNQAIGLFRENPDTMRAAAAYIEASSSAPPQIPSRQASAAEFSADHQCHS